MCFEVKNDQDQKSKDFFMNDEDFKIEVIRGLEQLKEIYKKFPEIEKFIMHASIVIDRIKDYEKLEKDVHKLISWAWGADGKNGINGNFKNHLEFHKNIKIDKRFWIVTIVGWVGIVITLILNITGVI